jgi:hypothetical protein
MMNMDWQLLLVAFIVTAAAGYLAREVWRSWRVRQSGCGGSCGCSVKSSSHTAGAEPTTFIASEQLTLRSRSQAQEESGQKAS